MRDLFSFFVKVAVFGLAIATTAQAAPGQRYDVRRDDTKIHAAPNAKARVLGRLNRGDRVIEWRRKGSWIEVSAMGVVGRNGWVHVSSLRSEAAEIEIQSAPDGHFYVDAVVNGESIRFLVDTGASNVALTRADAQRIGLNIADLRFTRQVRTANGITRSAPIVIDEISIGLLSVRNVRGGVNRGEMRTSLLGMTFLKKLRGYEVVGDRLLLRF